MRFIAQNRLEDGNLNSRGLSSPWKYDKKMKWRLCRRHYYVFVRSRGLESPRLFKATSFRRFRSSFFLQTFFAHGSSLTTHRSKCSSV